MRLNFLTSYFQLAFMLPASFILACDVVCLPSFAYPSIECSDPYIVGET